MRPHTVLDSPDTSAGADVENSLCAVENLGAGAQLTLESQDPDVVLDICEGLAFEARKFPVTAI